MQVDVDIMGSQNSMRQDYIEMQQRAFPWSVNGTDGQENGAVTLQVWFRFPGIWPRASQQSMLPETPSTNWLGLFPCMR